MDAYKRLLLELAGLEKNLEMYSRSSSAYNLLPGLKAAVISGDKGAVIYCLDGIIAWYEKNIDKIHFSAFCHSAEEHDRLFDIIKNIRKEIENCNISSQTCNNTGKSDEPLIFLSHNSSDKKYGDALEKFIIGLGVKNDQLIYTSHPLHKIPVDENIYAYLRRNINRTVFMIILWSNEYLESPACLNEMGAAWIVQCDYTNIYVPQFSFCNPKYHQCAVDTRKMGAVLNGDEHCKQAMIELKDKIQELFNLQNDEKKIIYLIDTLISEIKEDV